MNDLPSIDDLKYSIESKTELNLDLLSAEVCEQILQNAVGDYLLHYYNLQDEKGLFMQNYEGFKDLPADDVKYIQDYANRVANKNEKERKRDKCLERLQGGLQMYYNMFTQEADVRTLMEKVKFMALKINETKELLAKVKKNS